MERNEVIKYFQELSKEKTIIIIKKTRQYLMKEMKK